MLQITNQTPGYVVQASVTHICCCVGTELTLEVMRREYRQSVIVNLRDRF